MASYIITIESQFEDGQGNILAKLYKDSLVGKKLLIKTKRKKLTNKKKWEYQKDILQIVTYLLDKEIEPQSKVEIYLREKYLVECLSGYIFRWRNNNYKTKEGKSVVNKYYFKKYNELSKLHNISVSILTDGILNSLDSMKEHKKTVTEEVPDWL